LENEAPPLLIFKRTSLAVEKVKVTRIWAIVEVAREVENLVLSERVVQYILRGIKREKKTVRAGSK